MQLHMGVDTISEVHTSHGHLWPILTTLDTVIVQSSTARGASVELQPRVATFATHNTDLGE